MSKHAFAVYKIVTQSNGSKIIEVPTIDWRHALKISQIILKTLQEYVLLLTQITQQEPTTVMMNLNL
jgi:hypothetical protein